MQKDIWSRHLAEWDGSRFAVALALVCALSATGFVRPAAALEGEEISAVFGGNGDEKGHAREGSQDNAQNYTPDPDLATLYIMREKSLKGAAVKSKIYLNGQFVGQIGHGRYTVFHLIPGEYVVGVEPEYNKRSLKMSLDSEGLYYAKIRMKLGLFSLSAKSGHAKVEHVDEAQAKKLMRKLKPADPEMIKALTD